MIFWVHVSLHVRLEVPTAVTIKRAVILMFRSKTSLPSSR
jgi:hypothetical protein